MGPLEKIKNAWLQPGINPKEHRAQQAHLRRYWPTLYKEIMDALDAGQTTTPEQDRYTEVLSIVRGYFPDARVGMDWETDPTKVYVGISTTEGAFGVWESPHKLPVAVSAACQYRLEELNQHDTPANYMSWIGAHE